MKTCIVGATGFVGSRLVESLLEDSAEDVTVLTRSAAKAQSVFPPSVRVHEWDPSSGPPVEALRGAEAVINLAGENVAAGRWTPQRKRALRDSRVVTTQHLVEAIGLLDTSPRVLVNASAIGYYGPLGDEEVDETASAGSDFLADLCREWEDAACLAGEAGVRAVCVRVGIVLGHGGALAKMLLPFRLGVGGPLGSGRQWMSWIHVDDLVGMIRHAVGDPSISGPLNGTAPTPVTNREFTRTLGRVLRRPAFLPMPGFALRLLVGEFADILLTGQRVLPRKALDAGFSFRFAALEDALRAILR